MTENVSAPQARKLLRLLGEAHELADLAAIQRHLLGGILEIVGGVGVIRVQCYDFVSGRATDIRNGVDVGFDDAYRRRITAQYYEAPLVDPAIGEMCARHGELARDQLTAIRRIDVIDDCDWYHSPYVADIRRPARVDDAIYTARDIGGARCDGFGILRGWGDPRFDESDVATIRLFHHDVLSRFAVPTRELATLRLSPREREIMKLLLRGARRKAIAADLGLSVHTVDGYIKSLYRRMGVAGLPELLARCAELAS